MKGIQKLLRIELFDLILNATIIRTTNKHIWNLVRSTKHIYSFTTIHLWSRLSPQIPCSLRNNIKTFNQSFGLNFWALGWGTQDESRFRFGIAWGITLYRSMMIRNENSICRSAVYNKNTHFCTTAFFRNDAFLSYKITWVYFLYRERNMTHESQFTKGKKCTSVKTFQILLVLSQTIEIQVKNGLHIITISL